jgi:hypothetical protein
VINPCFSPCACKHAAMVSLLSQTGNGGSGFAVHVLLFER